MINYLNSGFMCPPIIDGQPQKPITFAESDLELGNISLKSVVKQSNDTYQIVDISEQSPSDSVVYGLEQDCSCYVSIFNNSNSALSKTGEAEVHGYYVVPPPQTISPGERAQFWIQDCLEVDGTEGNVSYTNQVSGKTITFRYTCSPIRGNNCSPEPFQDKSHNSDWIANQVVRGGHPYFVSFSIEPD